jgi:hypothetical protein
MKDAQPGFHSRCQFDNIYSAFIALTGLSHDYFELTLECVLCCGTPNGVLGPVVFEEAGLEPRGGADRHNVGAARAPNPDAPVRGDFVADEVVVARSKPSGFWRIVGEQKKPDASLIGGFDCEDDVVVSDRLESMPPALARLRPTGCDQSYSHGVNT